MKKIKKINILNNAVSKHDFCCCKFDYSDTDFYFYIVGVSDKFVYGAEEDDFMLDGFQIRKISQLKKVKVVDNLCSEINVSNKLLDGLDAPQIDLKSWRKIFESLRLLNTVVIIENDYEDNDGGFFFIGYIKEVTKSSVAFFPFDADGVFREIEYIPYSEITSVTFRNRYCTVWHEYLKSHNMLPE